MHQAAIQQSAELFAPEPIRPWQYVRMRRRSAGLTIEKAARPFYQREEHGASVEANLRSFEADGFRIQRIEDLDLQRAFPFDAAIYRLLNESPVEDHPRLCRRCGWDDRTVQPDRDGEDTTWSEISPNHCTRCEQDVRRAGRLP